MVLLKIIPRKELVCMNEYADKYKYHVDLAYARNDNLLFGERIYRENAKLWLHKDLAEIVFIAAKHCFKHHGMHFVLYDGLRTIDAQKIMMQTKRVQDNPHWLEEPRLLSPVGGGAHPRGMAIDIGLKCKEGGLLNMGSAFDCLSKLAHREYIHSQEVMANREILNNCMNIAAKKLNTPILLLPQEWWDFRLPPEIYEKYEPLSDNNLPDHMRLVI